MQGLRLRRLIRTFEKEASETQPIIFLRWLLGSRLHNSYGEEQDRRLLPLWKRRNIAFSTRHLRELTAMLALSGRELNYVEGWESDFHAAIACRVLHLSCSKMSHMSCFFNSFHFSTFVSYCTVLHLFILFRLLCPQVNRLILMFAWLSRLGVHWLDLCCRHLAVQRWQSVAWSLDSLAVQSWPFQTKDSVSAKVRAPIAFKTDRA